MPFLAMSREVGEKILDPSVCHDSHVLKVNGVYSGLRPILHLSLVEICLVVIV